MSLTTLQSSIRSSLQRRRSKKIYDVDGNNMTPKPLRYIPREDSKKSISSSRGSTAKTSISKSLLDEIDIDDLEVDDHKLTDLTDEKKKIDDDTFSETCEEVTVFLKETSTFWLLDINSSVVPLDPDSSTSDDKVSEKKTNQPEDEFEKQGLKRNKKDTFVQTFSTVNKKKLCQTSPINTTDSYVFATEWDLYDTYRKTSCDGESDEEILHGETPQISNKKSKKIEVKGNDRIPDDFCLPETEIDEEKSLECSRNDEIIKLFRMPRFKHAMVIAERLLGSNVYTAQQTSFSGIIVDDLKTPIGFHYIMKLLWTFSLKKNDDRTVTAISWNTVNLNIIAAGYGKYFYEDEMDGLVCCWNVKNPDQPEKIYPINDVVTALSFSVTEPNLLAVGCYRGEILLLNISTKNGERIVINGNVKPTQFGTVWDVKWFMYTNFVTETEEIISVGHNGHVWKWNHREEYACFELMKLQFSPPEVRSIVHNPTDKIKYAVDITVKNLTGLSLSVHPKKPMIYYVTTAEGCIVKCAINHPERHIDIFPAHAGSIYGIQHSPFSENIFITYGSDWAIYLWVENLHEPLLKFCCSKAAVEGAKWSPTHATIFASISGSRLSIWDLARKVIVPMSTIKSHTGIHLFSLEFSPTGKNILIGDIEGNIFVYNLVDMPFPPYLQKEALIQALENALITKPEMLKKLKMILSPTIPLIN